MGENRLIFRILLSAAQLIAHRSAIVFVFWLGSTAKNPEKNRRALSNSRYVHMKRMQAHCLDLESMVLKRKWEMVAPTLNSVGLVWRWTEVERNLHTRSNVVEFLSWTVAMFPHVSWTNSENEMINFVRSFVLTLFIFKAPNYVLARTLTERVI